MASTISEILWVRWLLNDLQVVINSLRVLFCDNQAARHIANNPVFHDVGMNCFFVGENVASQEIALMKIDNNASCKPVDQRS